MSRTYTPTLKLPGFTLDDYVKDAVSFLQEHEPPEGYFVGFSGGKDSIVTEAMCKLSGVKHEVYYTYTTIDIPEVVSFVRQHYPHVHILRPKKSFFELLQSSGPPLRMQRWCCGAIKERPSWKIPMLNRVFGLRAEESVRRAKRGQIDTMQAGDVLHTHYKPIFDWPEWAVWEYIDNNNLPYPALYDKGWNRIGCMFCPYSTIGATKSIIAARKQSIQMWPGPWKAFEHAVKRYYSKRQEKKLEKGIEINRKETAEIYWQNYLMGFDGTI